MCHSGVDWDRSCRAVWQRWEERLRNVTQAESARLGVGRACGSEPKLCAGKWGDTAGAVWGKADKLHFTMLS